VRTLRATEMTWKIHGYNKRVITKWILEKSVGRAWIGFLCLRIGIGGGMLQKQ